MLIFVCAKIFHPFSYIKDILAYFIDVVLKYNYIAHIIKVFHNEVKSFSPRLFEDTGSGSGTVILQIKCW